MKALNSATRAKSSNKISQTQADKTRGQTSERKDQKTTPTGSNMTNIFKMPNTPKTPKISKSA